MNKMLKKHFNWKKEEKKAENDIKKSNLKTFCTVKKAIKWLKK